MSDAPERPDVERDVLRYLLDWIDAEVAHPRPDPHPAMALQARVARAWLANVLAAAAPDAGLRVALDNLVTHHELERVAGNTHSRPDRCEFTEQAKRALAAAAAVTDAGPDWSVPVTTGVDADLSEYAAAPDAGLRAKAWYEDAHGEVVLLSDAEDALAVTDARLREIAAMLDDELRRVEAGYSTPESLRRARATYAAALSRQKETA